MRSPRWRFSGQLYTKKKNKAEIQLFFKREKPQEIVQPVRSTDPITTHRQHGSNDIIIRHRIGQIFYPRRWSRQMKLIPFSRQNGQNTNQSETRCWTSDGDGGRGNLIIKRRTRKKRTTMKDLAPFLATRLSSFPPKKFEFNFQINSFNQRVISAESKRRK